VLYSRLPTDFSKPIHVDLPISHAGAFCYWIEYDSEDSTERVKGREGYFNIDPVLRTKARTPILTSGTLATPSTHLIAKDDVALPLDGLSILTVVSKWMGPLSAWRPHFAEAAARGYTMLHYTPLQKRGESGSPYSIAGQDVYDPELFGTDAVPADGGKAEVEKALQLARDEFGLLSLTDVVLNHTASDSAWLNKHPEAGRWIGCVPELLAVLTRRIQASAPRTRRTLRRRLNLTRQCSSSQHRSRPAASRRWSPRRPTSTRSSTASPRM
jgi:glycogen debranching enzyme